MFSFSNNNHEKNAIKVWVVNRFDSLAASNISPMMKSWCKMAISCSPLVLEFLIDNYKKEFKGLKNINGGLKEIVAYLVFDSLANGGDPFIDKMNVGSISELVIGFGSIFEFDMNSYKKVDSYIFDYQNNNKERNLSAEVQKLLFGIVTESNPPMKEFPEDMKLRFKENVFQNLHAFNILIRQNGLLG